MASGEPIRQIEQLRRYRARPARKVAIEPIILTIQQHATRTNRKLGQLIDCWEATLPGELVRRTAVTGLRGGTAHVAVDSASTSFEVDRLLREGMLAELKQRFPGTLIRVRVRIAPDALRGE